MAQRIKAEQPVLSKKKVNSIIPHNSDVHPGTRFEFCRKKINKNGNELYRLVACIIFVMSINLVVQT